jgi:hypothetical protein
MWEFLIRLVEALPVWFLAALIVFLLGAAAWILPRLRRDKNGRLYVFSRSYEFQKNRIKAQGKETRDILRSIGEIKDRMRSIEREDLKQSFYLAPLPKDERLIAGLKYVYAGGNGPVREDVARFVEENPETYREVITRFPQWALLSAGRG